MNESSNEIIEFKYTWSDESGAQTGTTAGGGLLKNNELQIGSLNIALTDIHTLSVIENSFIFGLADAKMGSRPLIIEIYDTDVISLENRINAQRSRIQGQVERTHLIQTGRLSEYREEICPFCQSTIALTGLPATPQGYCQYCNSLFTIDQTPEDKIEQDFRICDHCDMYSRPRKFAVFYFYYLVVTFGFNHDTTVRCSGCMRSSAWKMVFGNLLGVLGFPFALIQLFRSYSTRSLTGRFEGLDTANVLARKGRIDKALQHYDEIMDRVPENAGVKYNIAFGLMVKRDYENAQAMFELALDDCSNYWPAVSGLLSALQHQGKSNEVKAVQKVWGISEEK